MGTGNPKRIDLFLLKKTQSSVAETEMSLAEHEASRAARGSLCLALGQVPKLQEP